MSSSKGNLTRKRPQKHQNRTSFKNDLHDTSTKTKFLNSLQISGVCKRCKEKIDWKIKYKKYKPLTAPKKCVRCEEKTVKHAYHVMCLQCARKENVCAKCCKPEEVIVAAEINSPAQDSELQMIIKSLPERKRRTLLRYINKHSDKQKEDIEETVRSAESDDFVSKIEKLKLSVKDKTDINFSDFGSDDEASTDDSEDESE